MSIDKQRISAVATLQALGFRWDGVAWVGQREPATLQAEADALHGALMDVVERFGGVTEDSEEERVLSLIADAMDNYEQVRWPDGKIPGGKG